MNYKHERLIRELISASGESEKTPKVLEAIIPRWKFSHFTTETQNCQLCHTPIKRAVVIKNEDNGVYLMIGHECYDKLAHYLAAKNIESSMATRKEYAAKIKEHAEKHRIDASFLAWFRAQPDLPLRIKMFIHITDDLGHPPSIEMARELVGYYRRHRRFSIRALLAPQEIMLFNSFPHKSLLPLTITLWQLPKLKKILHRWQETRMRTKPMRRFVECMDKCEPVSLFMAAIFAQTYFQTYFIEKIACVRLTMLINLGPNERPVVVILPEDRFKEELHITTWRESCTKLLEKTMPKQARIRRQKDEFRVYNSDIELWIERAKKLLVSTAREKGGGLVKGEAIADMIEYRRAANRI